MKHSKGAPNSPRRQTWVIAAIVLIALAAGSYVVHRLTADPHVFLLVGARDSAWIVRDQPPSLRMRKNGRFLVTFRKRFTLSAPVREADLVVYAFRQADVSLDGRWIAQAGSRPLDDWKQPLSIDLATPLAAGPHELVVRVENENAPPALWLRSEALHLRTGEDWEAQGEGQGWTAARAAAAARPTELSRRLLSAPAALWEKLPLLATVFVFAFWATLRLEESAGVRRRLPRASTVRWGVLAAWAILGANNLLQLRKDIGFDADGHYEYIRYIAEGHGLPLATDGWQMFQSPLYYLVSAPLWWVFGAFFDPDLSRGLLRIVPFACGAAQVQLAYLALRRTFAEREDLQAIGTIFAGLLPMNLYISQGLGNESMEGFLSGATLVASLALLEPAPPSNRRHLLAGVGLLLGLALLAKVTAILLLPPLLGAIAWSRRRDMHRLRLAAIDTALVLGTAGVVCGWYYARNWMHLGRPFIGGWDASRGIAWWQDPGYRTPEEMLRFGEALVHPVTSGVVGFWDALYSTLWADSLLSGIAVFEARPPWNYDYLSASVLLALVPTVVLLAGATLSLAGGEPRRRAMLRFALVAIGVQLAALLDFYVRLPVSAAGKAHYAVGVVVCFAMLLAAGLERLGRNPVVRAALYGGLATWGVAVYATYLIVP